jgi:predicted kinase
MALNLLIIRGAPGSGKSTIANALMQQGLYAGHLEADMYFLDAEGNYKWDAKKVYDAHAWCRKETARLLKMGFSVVVANTFSRDAEVQPYWQIAEEHQATYQEMILWETPFENIHKVPVEKVEEYKARLHKQFSQ